VIYVCYCEKLFVVALLPIFDWDINAKERERGRALCAISMIHPSGQNRQKTSEGERFYLFRHSKYSTPTDRFFDDFAHWDILPMMLFYKKLLMHFLYLSSIKNSNLRKQLKYSCVFKCLTYPEYCLHF